MVVHLAVLALQQTTGLTTFLPCDRAKKLSTLLFCLTHFSPYGIWDRLRSPDDPIFYKLKNLDGWLC